MASYLRPRRGKKATAETQAIVLKRGEVFFECPTTGVGTGKGKIKVGDGSTSYSSLPYFLDGGIDLNGNDATVAFTDSNTATDQSNNATYLTNIAPASSLKTIFTNLKQLLVNYNAYLTSLNNDLNQQGGKVDTMNTKINTLGSNDTKISGTYVAYTMTANNWNANTHTYSFESSYPVATYDLEVSLANTATEEQVAAACNAVMLSSATENKLVAMGDVPTVNIPVILHVMQKPTSLS